MGTLYSVGNWAGKVKFGRVIMAQVMNHKMGQDPI